MRLPRPLLARVLLIVFGSIFSTGHCDSTEIMIRLIASGRGAEVVETLLNPDERWLERWKPELRSAVASKEGEAVSGWWKGRGKIIVAPSANEYQSWAKLYDGLGP